jgi:transcriptional regulator with XRE-family HTH domain
MDSDQIYRDLGIRIRDLRKGLRRTQDQLAKQVGISRASLANIEAGRQQVLVHHLFGLAEALQLESPAALLLRPRADAQRSRPARRGGASDLPLSSEGLTEKQRQEVLRLMGDALNNNHENSGREDE